MGADFKGPLEKGKGRQMQKFLIGLALLLVAVVVAGWVMPTSYAIEKEITIEGTPAQVHAYVGDLQKWSEWAPWEKMDPTVKTTFGEKTTGVGASQSWTSEEEGDGELTFTKSDENTGIAYDMAFIMEEMRAPATCAMTYSADSGKTTVTWTMEGDIADFMPPIVSGLMTPIMKSSIGGMFDEGLTTLKEKVEATK